MKKTALAGKASGKKEQKKKPISSSTYAKLLGLGGLGSLALGRGVGNADDIVLAQNAISNFNPESFERNARNNNSLIPITGTGTTEYIKAMAPLANLKPWGLAPADVITKVRQNEPLLQALTGSTGYALSNPSEIAKSKAHYQSYTAGPIPAYYHQIKSQLQDTPLTDEEIKKLKLAPGTTYPDWVSRKFEKYITDRFDANPVLPFEVNKDILSIPEQQTMLEDFMPKLTPAEQDLRRKYEKSTVEYPGTPYEFVNHAQQAKTYLNQAKPLLALRKGLYTAGGAGIGGYAGHRLYNQYGGTNSNIRRLATLLGAGAGGVIGHTASNPYLQKQIGDSVKNTVTGLNNNLGVTDKASKLLGLLASSVVPKVN